MRGFVLQDMLVACRTRPAGLTPECFHLMCALCCFHSCVSCALVPKPTGDAAAPRSGGSRIDEAGTLAAAGLKHGDTLKVRAGSSGCNSGAEPRQPQLITRLCRLFSRLKGWSGQRPVEHACSSTRRHAASWCGGASSVSSRYSRKPSAVRQNHTLHCSAPAWQRCSALQGSGTSRVQSRLHVSGHHLTCRLTCAGGVQGSGEAGRSSGSRGRS